MVSLLSNWLEFFGIVCYVFNIDKVGEYDKGMHIEKRKNRFPVVFLNLIVFI